MRLGTGTWIGSVAVIVTVSAVWPSGQQRDVPPQPSTRQVAVGTSTLHGRVVDAVTGMPVAQARVMVSGMTAAGVSRAMEPPPALPGGRGTLDVSVGMTVGGRGAVPGAQTSVNSLVANASRQAMTDRDGQFVINHLPAGRFQVSVTHRSYLPYAHGQRKPGSQGRPLELLDGQKLEVSAKMLRGGVVTGLVFDEAGAPVANARVQVWRSVPGPTGARMQAQNGANTDDRGVYRVFGLQPGDYVVSAQLPQVFENEAALEEAALIERAVTSGAMQPAAPGRSATVSLPLPQQRPGMSGMPVNAGILPTFAPSAASAEAGTRVTIAGGDEQAGIDIHLRRLRASMITGVITNMPSPSSGGARVQVQMFAEPFNGSTNGTSVNPQGEFSLQNLTAGTYTILAMTMPTNVPPPAPGAAPAPAPQQPRLSGRVTVTVPEDATVPVSLTLQPGRSISGSVTYDMTRQTTPPGGIMVRLQNLQGQPGMTGQLPAATVDQGGRFTLTDVPPGRYTIGGSMPVKSVQFAGQEVLDTFLEVGTEDINGVAVTFSDKFSSITGLVTSSGEYDPSEYTILIVSSDPQHWQQGSRRIVTTRANIAGRYTANVPPGSYFIGMVTDLEFGSQYDPEFLKALQAAAISVTVVDGARTTQDLRAGR